MLKTKPMTTTYETSLRMKELNFPQEHGEYYWVQSHGGEIYRVYGNTIRLNGCDGSILCRAFTLGELVGMLPDGFRIQKAMGLFEVWLIGEPSLEIAKDSPEEAAAELALELVKRGVIKFNQ